MKQAVKDFFRVFLSNGLLLISGILIGFFVPKIMGIAEYGYYKTFSLYNSYKELLTFGISEGMYLWLAGKDKDNEIISKFKLITIIFLLFESIISIIFIIVFGILYSYTPIRSIIFILTTLFCLGSNIESYFNSVSQAFKEFKVFSALVSIKSFLNIASVLSLYFFNRFAGFTIYFYTYALITITLCFINDFVYFIYYSRKFRHKKCSIDGWNTFLFSIIKLGIPLLLANLCQTLILTIDRQVISVFYPVEESNVFSIYSFAYNLLALVSSVVSVVSTVLYPYMKGKKEEKLIASFSRLHMILGIVLSFACCAFFVLSPIINWILPQYTSSLQIFKFLLPGIVISSSISVLFHSYYKAFGFERVYFIQSVLVLFLSLIANLGVYYGIVRVFTPDNPIAISIASTVVYLVWYIISIYYLSRRLKIVHLRNDLFMAISLAGFYFISNFWSNWWIGLIIYFCYISFLVFLFYYKKIRLLILGFINERRNKTN